MTDQTKIVRFACVALLIASSLVSAGEAEQQPPYELVEASPSVVMLLHENGSNISCVALDDGLVFVDSSLSTRVAKRFRSDMEARFDRPAKALVLTHAHLDHILGMGAFADLPVWAASAGRPRWEHFVGIEWDERAIAGYGAIFKTLPDEISTAALRMPTRWFDDKLEFDGAVIRRTGGHTVDSSSVFVEADKVVIAGDLVQARRRPYFGEADTDFDAWIGAMRDWEGLEPAAVCPGHGPVIDAEELRVVRVWFEDLTAAAAKLKARGVSLEEMVTHDELPAGYWPAEASVPRWWGFCVRRLYEAS